jgi:type I restriction enzyme S subunit
LKPYSEYKDLGVEWIGEIPEHWVLTKLKFLTKKIIDGTHITPTYVDQGVPFLRVTDIQSKTIDMGKVKFISKSEHKELIKRCNPEKGDLLLSKNGTIGLTKVIDWDFEFSIFVSLCLIKFMYDKLIPQYFTYVFDSKVTDEQIFKSSKKTSVTNLHLDKIRELVLLCPPLPEQKQIAKYLNHKTAKIDSLIENKRRLIELLKEERTAVINQAVTKGIDPNVPMKDSGIEWLGEIPAHWEVKRLKYVALLKSGQGITADQIYEEGEYPVYGGNGLRGFTSHYTHDGHFVLIGRQGALCGNINYAKNRFWASEHAVVVTPKISLETVWLGELLRAMDLNHYSVSAAQPGLSVDIINNLKVPFAPPREQKEIVEYIDEDTSRIERLISKSEKEIEFLQEYKTALISEVVTGKIDVREEQI